MIIIYGYSKTLGFTNHDNYDFLYLVSIVIDVMYQQTADLNVGSYMTKNPTMIDNNLKRLIIKDGKLATIECAYDVLEAFERGYAFS